MMNHEHVEVEDLTMFALQLLDAKETEAVRAHLQTCAACTHELGLLGKDMELYALGVQEVALPEGARDRFLESFSSEWSADLSASEQAVSRNSVETVGTLAPTSARASGPVAAAAPPVAPYATASTIAALPRTPAKTRSSLGRILPWVGWAAAAAALVVAAGLKQDRDALRASVATQNSQTLRLEADNEKARHILGVLSDPNAVRVNLTVPKAPATPAARTTYEAKSGTLLMMASNLAPLQPSKVYELWLIPADGGKPIPAGTFVPDGRGNASLLMPTVHGAVTAKAFGITVEPAGGSTTPTLPIVLAGAPA